MNTEDRNTPAERRARSPARSEPPRANPTADPQLPPTAGPQAPAARPRRDRGRVRRTADSPLAPGWVIGAWRGLGRLQTDPIFFRIGSTPLPSSAGGAVLPRGALLIRTRLRRCSGGQGARAQTRSGLAASGSSCSRMALSARRGFSPRTSHPPRLWSCGVLSGGCLRRRTKRGAQGLPAAPRWGVGSSPLWNRRLRRGLLPLGRRTARRCGTSAERRSRGRLSAANSLLVLHGACAGARRGRSRGGLDIDGGVGDRDTVRPRRGPGDRYELAWAWPSTCVPSCHPVTAARDRSGMGEDRNTRAQRRVRATTAEVEWAT